MLAVVTSVYPIVSQRIFLAVNFFRSSMVPEFLLLGLLHEAVVPTGFPWICWVTVWRIMSRSSRVSVIFDSKLGPKSCARAAGLANAAATSTSGLIGMDMGCSLTGLRLALTPTPSRHH